MESFGNPEKEGKFNTPISAPHTITYSSSSPLYLAQVAMSHAEQRSIYRL